MTKLTGNVRYRVQHRMFGADLVVLQVEEEVEHIVPCGPSVDIERFRRWRDARPEDVMTYNPWMPPRPPAPPPYVPLQKTGDGK